MNSNQTNLEENINFHEMALKIISYSNEAKNNALNAIREAKKGNQNGAQKLIEDSNLAIIVAERVHLELLSFEASGEKIITSVLLMHAEDQLLNSQTIKMMAQEFIGLYKEIKKTPS